MLRGGYRIRVAHNERGYRNASVRATQNGDKQVFEVKPGRIYQVKDLPSCRQRWSYRRSYGQRSGIREIYSAVRMDDWMTTINKQYGRPGKLGSHIRSRKAQSNDRSETRPRQLWQAHTAASITWPLVDRNIGHCAIPTLDRNDKR